VVADRQGGEHHGGVAWTWAKVGVGPKPDLVFLSLDLLHVGSSAHRCFLVPQRFAVPGRQEIASQAVLRLFG
jgi:hypothetical protein